MNADVERERAALVERCDVAASALAEHCDSVQIFVTRQMEDGSSETISYEVGRGNFYARIGQVVEWLCIQDQFQRNHADRKDAQDHG